MGFTGVKKNLLTGAPQASLWPIRGGPSCGNRYQLPPTVFHVVWPQVGSGSWAMMADEGGIMVDFIGMRKDEMIWNDRYLWIFSIRRSVHGRVVRKSSHISKQTNRPYFAIAIPLGFCTWLVTLSIHTSPLYKPPYPTSLNTQTVTSYPEPTLCRFSISE